MSISYQRTLLRVALVGNSEAKVFIPGWDGAKKTVELPLKVFPYKIDVKPGMRFDAWVNLNATEPLELYITDLKLLPEPNQNDGL